MYFLNSGSDFVTIPYRYDPELCDVVRASEVLAASSPSAVFQPVVIQSVATAGESPVIPPKPASFSKETEMQASDSHADLMTIPNTPIDKL